MELLVSTEQLAAMLDDPALRLLDASYFPLDPARDPLADYEAGHIPNALFLDLAHLADPAALVGGMLPPPDQFAARLAALGLDGGQRIVLYDNTAHRTAARAWWMFRVFGMRHVAILDGGLQKWKAEGRELWSGRRPAPHGHVDVAFDATSLRDLDQMRANLESDAEQVVDARGAKRFTGEEADPRGLADGHIPGSRNLPYDRVLNPDGTFRSPQEIRAAFAAAGVDLARPLVTTCGSGVTAATILFAAALAGKEDVALYDGSWSEWGALPDTPKETGQAR